MILFVIDNILWLFSANWYFQQQQKIALNSISSQMFRVWLTDQVCIRGCSTNTSMIHWSIESVIVYEMSSIHCLSQTVRPREVTFWECFPHPPPTCVPCHVSRVMCHMSHVTCHMTYVTCIFFLTKWWSFSVEGL